MVAKARMKNLIKIAILCGVLAAVGLYLRPTLFPTPRSLPPIHYQVVVTDAATTKGVIGASVEIAERDSQPKSATTDSSGVVRFDWPPSTEFLTAKLRIRADRFEFVDRDLKFPPQDYEYAVALKPLGVTVGSSLLKDRKPYTRFYSREVSSGRGSEFSPMIELAAEPPQNGYEIDLGSGVTRFSLSGDRACGAWSECSWKVHTSQQVVFQFRVQGHSEWIFGGSAYSQGILQVQYIPTVLHLTVHGRSEDSRALKTVVDKLNQLPFTIATTALDYTGEETRLEYFGINTEDEAKSLREAVCETLAQPFGWLPVRRVLGEPREKNVFDVWIREAPR